MAKVTEVEDLSKEMDALRKERRVALGWMDAGCLPQPEAFKHVPQFGTKDLHLDSLCDAPDFQTHCVLKSRFSTGAWLDKGRQGWGDRRYTPTQAHKDMKVIDVCQAVMHVDAGAAYYKSVEATTCQLKQRELHGQERYMVEAEARLEMAKVRDKKVAENMKEALQEWIDDAQILLKLNQKDSFYSLVSHVHEEKKEEGCDDKTTSLSFSTRYNGKEFTITVEMPNDDDVRVTTLPLLTGAEEQIVEVLSLHCLLDAITGSFWKMAAPRG